MKRRVDLGKCPKCGGSLIIVNAPNDCKSIWCSRCERMYYNPKLDEDGLKREFMRQFGNDEQKQS